MCPPPVLSGFEKTQLPALAVPFKGMIDIPLIVRVALSTASITGDVELMSEV
jgi:hypothetical protein